MMKPTKKQVIIGILLLVGTIGGAIIINEAYKIGKGYITLWEPADTLSFYGAYLSFVGTVVLGAIAVYQNKKAQEVNDQLQKMQQAQFVSMVSIKEVNIEKRSSNTPSYLNRNMQDIEIITLVQEGFKSSECFYVDMRIKNDSDFPIVQLQIHPGQRNNGNALFYGLQTIVDTAIYIGKGEEACFRLIIPSKIFDETKEYKLQICMDFINVFDYRTPTSLFIDDLSNKNYRNTYKYRISKFTDIRS